MHCVTIGKRTRAPPSTLQTHTRTRDRRRCALLAAHTRAHRLRFDLVQAIRKSVWCTPCSTVGAAQLSTTKRKTMHTSIGLLVLLAIGVAPLLPTAQAKGKVLRREKRVCLCVEKSCKIESLVFGK